MSQPLSFEKLEALADVAFSGEYSKAMAAEEELQRAIDSSVILDLLDERKRLRKALESIELIEHQMYGGDWDEIEEAQRIARAALQGKQQ